MTVVWVTFFTFFSSNGRLVCWRQQCQGKCITDIGQKRDSLESKFCRASSEKISCLQETVSLLNQCIGEENQGWLQIEKELEVLGKDFKKQMKEKGVLLQNCVKKRKIKKS